MYCGGLPLKQLKLVLALSELHRDELIKNWQAAQGHMQLVRINPLQ